jgi:uncharacterized protein (TIGR00730 family)
MARFPKKAYNNHDFLNSPPARHIRILCEYEETRQRFIREKIENTIVFFGSARTLPEDVAVARLDEAKAALAVSPDDPDLIAAAHRAGRDHEMSAFYEAARDLAGRFTRWGMSDSGEQSHYISTGGGPGIMEAGNRGAAEAGGRSVGLGISLPFEAGVNDYVSEGLEFEFHYFFTRKYWFLYLCKALVVFPGGFGTMDEFFESLTLIQTGKITKRIPVILYGAKYWSSVLNLKYMAEMGTISVRDLDLFLVTDSLDEAFAYVTKHMAGG